jgi:hypothetical protein
MWRRASRASIRIRNVLRCRQASAMVVTTTNYRGILVGRCFVRDIQAEAYSETSAL